MCYLYGSGNPGGQERETKEVGTFRFLIGQAVDATDPHAALAAYRDSVVFFDPVEDRGAWASCKACIGWGLAALGKVAPPESEEVIECLEEAIDDFPYAASTLAAYYAARTIGDPLEKKQFHYLELALGQVSPERDPVEWARRKNNLMSTVQCLAVYSKYCIALGSQDVSRFVSQFPEASVSFAKVGGCR